MDKVLRPERFDVNPNEQDAAKCWQHWLVTFENFVMAIPEEVRANKLNVLVNFVSSDIYQLFCDASTYDEAIALLKSLYVKTPNEVFARHKLATRKQQSNETMDEFMQALKVLSKDCNFSQVSAAQHRDEAVRDAFISGLFSATIRQRLLQIKTLDLQMACDQARSLDIAQKNSDTYHSGYVSSAANVNASKLRNVNQQTGTSGIASFEYGNEEQSKNFVSEEELNDGYAAASRVKCFFCGNRLHPGSMCPAKEAFCYKCKKKGHFHRVCRSTAAKEPQSAYLTLAASNTSAKSLENACIEVLVEGKKAKALVDSGSSHSFIHPEIVKHYVLKVYPTLENVTMATSSFSTDVEGYCFADLIVNNRIYTKVKLYILRNLCIDIILGQNWQAQHESVTIDYGGPVPSLKICGLSTLDVDPPPSLFQYLTAYCKPIATKSRRYSNEDKLFISDEIEKLLENGIIEPSDSPWRAQVVVTRNKRQKKRLVIDYSQTINKFTQLDAYPLPRIDDTVTKIAQYRVFSTIDLKSAYHQVPMREDEKIYTAFEANNRLYHFCRVPFGVTNGAAAFQRTMDNSILEESLQDTFAYLDNITICGHNKAHHDKNLKNFLEASNKRNLTFNNDKCTFSTTSISVLGSVVSDGEIRPDPERLQPLRELLAPKDLKVQKRVIGLFSYYSHWIKDFSTKVRPLTQNNIFPLRNDVLKAFNLLKFDVENAVLRAIDESLPFQVETDVSEFTISATLNQHGRPVAFFSRTLVGPELKHSSVEKEAAAIVEAVRKWKHYLTGKHFKLVTDQRSVAYMFNSKRYGKVKNEKIMRWRLELSTYDFDIVYRAGVENIPADALSRVRVMSLVIDDLYKLHHRFAIQA